MNLFERQAARRRAGLRVALLIAFAVFGIVIAVDLIVWIVLATREDVDRTLLLAAMAFATVATLAAIALGSCYRLTTLRDGGDAIAQRLGGVHVPAQTRDPQWRRLQSVVETLAVASGVPMPRLYVLERESAINAFAAGHAPADAAVAVTRGALERLARDELQGMIAQVFGRLLAGDLRGDLRLTGLLFGLQMPALAGRRMLDAPPVAQRGRGAVAMAATTAIVARAAIAFGYVGLSFARMIRADVHRPRALSADAVAAQCARHAAGLVGALKKIAALDGGATLVDASVAEEIGHMLFADGVGLGGPFATHPSPMARIRALEPSFGDHALSRLREQWRAQPPNGLEEDARPGTTDAAPWPDATVVLPVTPAMIVARAAQTANVDDRRIDALVARIPAPLRALAGDRDHVAVLALACLLDDDADVRRRQHGEIAARLGRETAVMAQAVRDEQLPALHPLQRLPLATLAFPTLRLRPRAELSLILDTLQATVNADGRVSLFEHGLGTWLHTQLREAMDPSLGDGIGHRRASAATHEIATLLALVARAGRDDPAQAQRAYLAGLQRALPHDHIAFAPPAQGVLALDAAWPTLDALDPSSKQGVVEAVAVAIARDGVVGIVDAELLRVVCGALHCPLPPMLDGAV